MNPTLTIMGDIATDARKLANYVNMTSAFGRYEPLVVEVVDRFYHPVMTLAVDHRRTVTLTAVRDHAIYERQPRAYRGEFTPELMRAWSGVDPADHADY